MKPEPSLGARELVLTPVPPQSDVIVLPVATARTAIRWTVLGLVAAAMITVAPLWLPIVLAAWGAILAKPLQRRLAQLVRGRSRAAAVVTVVFVLAVLTPIVITVLSLFASAVDLATRLSHTENGWQALGTLFSGDAGASPLDPSDSRQVVDLLQRHGASALGAVRTLFGALASVGVGLFVFVFAFYTFLVEGSRSHQWLVEHAPLPRQYSERLTAAFEETGRGLFVSLGGTALLQGTLATIGYLIIGVPEALLLGMLTAIGSFIPIVGTGLVWAPVAIGLSLLGRGGQGLAVLVLGVVVSGLDNFVRPWLSRYGQLQLPTFVVFAAMLGGIAAFGAVGPLLGPLLVRLALEAIRIWQDDRRSGRASSNS